MAAAFADARTRHGEVEILVNNAGIALSRPFAKLDAATWAAVIGINLTGTYNCTHEAVSAMIAARHGRIVNIASTAGLVGGKYIAAYCAAKHGVIGLTRALATELAANGITVNAVCPGFTETAMLERAVSSIVATTGRSRGGRSGGAPVAQPAGPLRAPRRGRRRGAVAVPARGGCDHRTDHRHRRRRGAALVLERIDTESRATHDDHLSVRVWLRLLACTNLIEGRVSGRLRDEFDTTLPRFDLIAQLERNAGGLRMTEISKRMMVTGGNITRIADQLLAEGLDDPQRRAGRPRASIAKLSSTGPAGPLPTDGAAHERWIVELLRPAVADTTARNRLCAARQAQTPRVTLETETAR